jgi:hypothetical protein
MKQNKKIYFLSIEGEKISEKEIYKNDELREYCICVGEYIIQKDFYGYSYILLRENQYIIKVDNNNIFYTLQEAKDKINEIKDKIMYRIYEDKKEN